MSRANGGDAIQFRDDGVRRKPCAGIWINMSNLFAPLTVELEVPQPVEPPTPVVPVPDFPQTPDADPSQPPAPPAKLSPQPDPPPRRVPDPRRGLIDS